MKKVRIYTVNVALSESNKRIAGATQHGATIGLVHNTPEAITAERGDLLTARNAHDATNVELKAKQAVVRSLTKTINGFATLTREFLKPSLGRGYSTAWDVTGFVGSLEVPRSVEGLKALLERLHAYFTANPGKEVPAVDITAVKMKALLDQLVAAENALNAQKTATRTAREERQEKFTTLCKRLSDLSRELAQKLAPLDTRYLAFGLPLPGAKATPDVPTNIIAALVGPNAIAVKWDSAARAEHYRVWWKVNNAEGDPVAAGNPADLDFTLEGLPSNSFIEISVSAVNNGGESLKSSVVTVQTPA